MALFNFRFSTASTPEGLQARVHEVLDLSLIHISGVYGGGWEDGYDISRVLLPDMLERVPVRGRPVFMMPTRDLLLVSGDNDDDGLMKMVELCQQVIPHGRPVSPCMYRHGEAGVERFVPPHDELRQRQANLARMLAKGCLLYTSRCV